MYPETTGIFSKIAGICFEVSELLGKIPEISSKIFGLYPKETDSRFQ
jgi:hypothetical protein